MQLAKQMYTPDLWKIETNFWVFLSGYIENGELTKKQINTSRKNSKEFQNKNLQKKFEDQNNDFLTMFKEPFFLMNLKFSHDVVGEEIESKRILKNG